MDASNFDPLLTDGDLAEHFNCSETTSRNWRVRGEGPRWIKVGRLVRYRLSDVLAYEAERTRQSTSEYEAA